MRRATSRAWALLFAVLSWPLIACGEVRVGDCVVFREGGEGRLVKTPTYWLKGQVSGMAVERRQVGVCPQFAKARSAYTREERMRLAKAAPCVNHESETQEAEVSRVRVVVDSWETPWSVQHGAAGLLFRGNFMEHSLTKGAVVDIDAAWLERCDAVF